MNRPISCFMIDPSGLGGVPLASGKAAANRNRYEDIPLEQLIVSDFNVRKRDISGDVSELANSISTIGLQQPIVVQQREDKYEIVIGQRRYLAAKQLGWETISAKIISEPYDELEAKAVSFSENIQRRDLSPRDKADACTYLLEELGTIRAVAQRLGITEQTVRKWLGYAGVPDRLKEMVENKAISPLQATRLSQFVPDEDRAVAIASRLVEMGAPKQHRDRVMAVVEESPEMPMDAIFSRAEEKRKERRIILILPYQWSLALDRASRRLQTDPTDIARDAVIEWLDVRRF